MAVTSESADNLLEQQFEAMPELRFSYETDIETPLIVKCAIFCAEHGYEFAPALLQKEGSGPVGVT